MNSADNARRAPSARPAPSQASGSPSNGDASSVAGGGKDSLKLTILGREFFVACGEEDRDSLDSAANYLDEQMRIIRDSGKVLGMERCAIMAALNMSYELQGLREQAGVADDTEDRLRRIAEKIDSAMEDTRQIAL